MEHLLEREADVFAVAVAAVGWVLVSIGHRLWRAT